MAHSQLKQINTRVPQGGVLSPTLFNIYTSIIPLPPKNIQITTYANVITITASHTKHHKTQQLIQPYLHKIYEWATTKHRQNYHHIFYTRPTEYSTTLSLKLNNQTLPITKHPKNSWNHSRPKTNIFTTYKCHHC